MVYEIPSNIYLAHISHKNIYVSYFCYGARVYFESDISPFPVICNLSKQSNHR